MAGWKRWAIGEVVDATDFQNYVQDQVVQVYATEAARGSALGTAVSAGMMSYITATGALQVYGTAWANVSNPGDITAVTAGTGLTGGGTSGDVTLNVNMSAISIPAAQINNLGTGVAAFLTNPTSENLRLAVTGETGTGNLVYSNNPGFGGAISVIGSSANVAIGRFDGTAATPFIDFNSGATVVDYDSRIIATGGNGTAGNGTLQVLAGTLNLPATTNIGSVSATELSYLDGVTSAIQTQLNAKAPFTQPIVTLAGTTTAYTAVAGDANDALYSLATATCTVTVPDLFAVGDRIDIVRDGAGTVVIAAGTGVTSWAGAGTAGTAVTFKIDQQYNAATVLKVANNTYRVIGRVTV